MNVPKPDPARLARLFTHWLISACRAIKNGSATDLLAAEEDAEKFAKALFDTNEQSRKEP